MTCIDGEERTTLRLLPKAGNDLRGSGLDFLLLYVNVYVPHSASSLPSPVINLSTYSINNFTGQSLSISTFLPFTRKVRSHVGDGWGITPRRWFADFA